MNLPYMIELQGGLMAHIKKAKKLEFIPLDLTVTAFLVELGECMNEWRGFKYWSEDQKPKKELKKFSTIDGHNYFEEVYKRPLLEEYVDGLHFVLQIVILSGFEDYIVKNMTVVYPKEEDIDKQVKKIWRIALNIDEEGNEYLDHAYNLLDYYLGLGEMLGFTTREIETAYLSKNTVNHIRQRDGY